DVSKPVPRVLASGRYPNCLKHDFGDRQELKRKQISIGTYWNQGYGYQQGYGPGYGSSDDSPHGYYGYGPGYYYRRTQCGGACRALAPGRDSMRQGPCEHTPFVPRAEEEAGLPLLRAFDLQLQTRAFPSVPSPVADSLRLQSIKEQIKLEKEHQDLIRQLEALKIGKVEKSSSEIKPENQTTPPEQFKPPIKGAALKAQIRQDNLSLQRQKPFPLQRPQTPKERHGGTIMALILKSSKKSN
ncbi:Max Dimerization Protein 4, partial [Manis pentadactyla]